MQSLYIGGASISEFDQAERQLLQGLQYMSQGRPDLAIGSFRLAVSLAPDSYQTNFQLGCALTDPSATEESILYLRRAVELEPALIVGYDYLGVRLQKLGRFDEAIAYFERSLEMEPRNPGAYFGMIRCKRITEADRPLVGRLESLANDGPWQWHEEIVIHYGLGKAYDDLGEYEKAMGYFDHANRLAGQQAREAGLHFDPEGLRSDIDLLIKAFNPELFGQYRSIASDSEQPMLIVGMMRSGTTLTEQILSGHPQIAAGGELSFWCDREASEILLAAARGQLQPARMTEVIDGYRRLIRSIGPRMSRVTDKQPANYLHLGLIHLLFPKARLIHCRRNPIDTCLSIYTTPLGNAPVDYAYDRHNIVFAYEQYLRLMDHWRSVLPAEVFLEVDYEELVRDREGQARRLIEFAGLEWDEKCLQPEANDRVVKTPSLWQVRQPIYTTSVERWRNYEPWLGEFAALGKKESA